MDAVRPLNYAPRPSRSRSYVRWLYRWLWATALLAATFFWGPGTLRWIDFLYWQHRCQSYDLPSDRVVYEMTQAPPRNPHDPFQTMPLHGIITQPEKCWPAIHFDPTCDHSTVFLHEMRRPDGQWRIVWLHIPSRWADPYVNYTALMCDQWEVSWRPQNLCTWNYVNFVDNFPSITDSHHWKIYAGQLDPSDPSHLTVDYQIDGQRHTCDAWLNNQGQLLLSVRQ
jgi:hypothetical protein